MASITLVIANEIEILAHELGVRHTPVSFNGNLIACLIVGMPCRCGYHSFLLDLDMLTILLDSCVDFRGVQR